MTTERIAPPLPREAEWLLFELWRQVAESDESEISDRQLRMVARLVGICGRKAGMQAAELIIAVKDSWMAHPELNATDRQRIGWVLNEVISSCIDEFFRVVGATEFQFAGTDRHPRHQLAEHVTSIPHEPLSD